MPSRLKVDQLSGSGGSTIPLATMLQSAIPLLKVLL
jgi:hypothetical protein